MALRPVISLSESGTWHLASKLVMQVHDELVLEVTREELDEVRELVCSTMEGALQLSVPLDVEVHTGKDWADAK